MIKTQSDVKHVKVTNLEEAKALMTLTPDFPSPGVLFRDLSPVLANADALRLVAEGMLAPFGDIDYVAGIEARGFPLAGAIAMHANAGVVLIRKAGKLPRPVAHAEYELEYGTAALEIQDDIPAGSRVLVVDDVLATGGTALAACELIESIGAEVAGIAIVQEVAEINGKELLKDYPLDILF